MAIQMECFMCHGKMATTRKRCKCGVDMVAAKKLKRTKESRKAVRYWVKVVVNGKQVRLNPADYNLDPYSVTDAKKLQARFVTAKHEGRLEIFDKKIESTWSVGDLCDWHFSQPSTKKKKSFNTLKAHADSFCTVLGETKLAHLKPTDLNNYRAIREDAGKMPGTVNNEIWSVRAAVSAAVDDEKISADIYRVFKKVEKAEVARNDRVLTVEEFEQIYEKAIDHLKPILITGFWTGGRTREVLSLRWPQIDFQKGVIKISTLKKKNPQTREVPMAQPLLRTTQTLSKVRNLHDDHLFLWRGQSIEHILKSMKSAVTDAKLPYGRDGAITFKTLRHTFEQHCRRAVVHQHVINELMGHWDGSVPRRYDSIEDVDLKEAIQKLETHRKNVAQEVAHER